MIDPSAEDDAGWTLVQLSELVRRAEDLLLDGITLVGPFAHAGMGEDSTIELEAGEVRRVVAALAEGAEISEQLEQLAARLPEGSIEADYEDVRAAAAVDLEHGIADPRRLLVAARVLDVERGWPALAACLSAGDAVATWGELTVEALLSRFRGATTQLVLHVAGAAGIEPRAPLAGCQSEQLEALATELRQHASGRRPS